MTLPVCRRKAAWIVPTGGGQHHLHTVLGAGCPRSVYRPLLASVAARQAASTFPAVCFLSGARLVPVEGEIVTCSTAVLRAGLAERGAPPGLLQQHSVAWGLPQPLAELPLPKTAPATSEDG